MKQFMKRISVLLLLLLPILTCFYIVKISTADSEEPPKDENIHMINSVIYGTFYNKVATSKYRWETIGW